MTTAPFYEPQRAWMRDAACKGSDPEAFFPATGGGRQGVPVAAIAACSRCPVMEQCAEYAINTHAQHGIWGGMTVEQRNRRARKQLEDAS